MKFLQQGGHFAQTNRAVRGHYATVGVLNPLPLTAIADVR
jgi:hypothetical protein